MYVHNSFKNLTFYPNLNQSGNNKYYLRLLNRISKSFFRDYLNDLCLQTKQNRPIRDKKLCAEGWRGRSFHLHSHYQYLRSTRPRDTVIL